VQFRCAKLRVAVYADFRVAKIRCRVKTTRKIAGAILRVFLASPLLPLGGARDSGGAIAPTTIHTYRKATVLGRIAAESPQEAPWRFRGLEAESPACGASRRKRAQIPNGFLNWFLIATEIFGGREAD
jgi:hypothetical protein